MRATPISLTVARQFLTEAAADAWDPEQQIITYGEPGSAFGQRGTLVGDVHHPETGVDDDVRGLVRSRRDKPAFAQLGQPGAAVRARVLGHDAAVRQHAVRDQFRQPLLAVDQDAQSCRLIGLPKQRDLVEGVKLHPAAVLIMRAHQ